MKILFVIPKVKSLFGDENAVSGHPHVGIAYLTAVLKDNNIDVKIFDEGIEGERNKLFELVNVFNPNLIGVTAFSYCYQYAYDIVTELKTNTNYPVVVGGPHVSAVKGKILSDTRVDFGIKGEGEVTLLELTKEIQKSIPDFGKIPGLIWRKGEKIIENQDRQWIRDLDSLPLPDYEAFRLERYSYAAIRTLPLITSRGCPYGCNYCSVRLSMGRNFRTRSAENVVNEIEYWYQKGWNGFEINDDCFTLDMNRAMKICDLIIERGLEITYQLYNGIRPDRVTPVLLQKMKKSGCIFLSYGCEAGNNQILENIKKGFTIEKVKQAVEWTKEAGIRNSVNFIIGHPGETYEIALESLRLARSLPTDFVNFYNLVPYPGTGLFDWIDENARWLVDKDHYLEEISYRDNLPVFETGDFSERQRKKVLKKGFALYERSALHFRLGRILGSIVYFITKNRLLAKIGRNFGLGNKYGIKIYRFLSAKSRE